MTPAGEIRLGSRAFCQVTGASPAGLRSGLLDQVRHPFVSVSMSSLVRMPRRPLSNFGKWEWS